MLFKMAHTSDAVPPFGGDAKEGIDRAPPRKPRQHENKTKIPPPAFEHQAE